MCRLVFNSRGLNTKSGTYQIKAELEKLMGDSISRKMVYIVTCPGYEVENLIRDNCVEILGISSENIRFSGYTFPDYSYRPDIIIVGEGNTFEVLHYMRRYGITEYIKEVMNACTNKGCVYIGSSAGALIAGTDIMPAMLVGDSDSYNMYDYTGLGLFRGTIIPHYNREQLECFKNNAEEQVLNRYEKILAVSDDEVIVM